MHAYLIMHMSNPSQFPGEGVAGAFLGASMKWFAYIAVCVLLVQTVGPCEQMSRYPWLLRGHGIGRRIWCRLRRAGP